MSPADTSHGRRLDLALLGPLDTLLEERNVTRAAARLCLTQPTMSGILRRLRDHFDDPLLVRDGRRFVLSPLGASLVVPVRDALLRVDAALAIRPRFDPAVERRRFRIMASDYAIAVLLTPVRRDIARAAPGIGFTIEPMEAAAERVRDGTVDLCVTGNPRFAPDGDIPAHGDGHAHGGSHADAGSADAARSLHVEALFDERYLCIVDADRAQDGPATLDAFLARPHVTAQFADARGAPGTRATRSLPRVPAPHAAPVTRVPGFLSIPGLVTGTDAIGIVPERLWHDAMSRGGLRVLPVDFVIPGFTERLLWHDRFALDAGFQWLLERLREVARRLADKRSPDDFPDDPQASGPIPRT